MNSDKFTNIIKYNRIPAWKDPQGSSSTFKQLVSSHLSKTTVTHSAYSGHKK